MSNRLVFRACLIAFLLAGAAQAQDRRTVREPRIPSACVTLNARLSAPRGELSAEAETLPDTARLQDAIDHCAPGKAVELMPDGDKNIFLSGPLQLRAGVTLVVEANTALFASRNPRDYDVTPGSCGIVIDSGAGIGSSRGCKPLLIADSAPGSGIMGDGAIDGRGGALLLGQNVSWWDLAHTAKVEGRQQQVSRMLLVRKSDNFTLYRITLRNSPNFHVAVEQTDGFTAWGVKIKTPKTARNTDGIDPSSSTNVTIVHCDIDTGDDNIAIKSGPTGAATHMTIAHNHFYSGHGMSIGSGTSGGVSAIRVSDLSIDGADNGLRIKSDRSRGGVVEDVVYENVCMRNVVNPIVFTPMYTTFPGNRLPVYRNIILRDVRTVTNGAYTFLGLDPDHKVEVTFDNVTVDVPPQDVRAQNAVIRIGPRAGNFRVSGPEVTISESGDAPASPLNCEGRFPAFPEIPTAPAAAVRVPEEDKTLYVAADGTGDYYSIQRAVNVAPAEGAVISVSPGVYRERLKISKPNIVLRGSNRDAAKTVVVFNESAKTTGSTFLSDTVEVDGDNFRAENITFANDYNATHVQEKQGSQALALLVTADRAIFRNVRLLGNQDTLYAGTRNCSPPSEKACPIARQYFSHCYIEGNVDFIFGNSKAVFEDCEIHNTPHSIGYVTAQGKHYPEQDSTFVFNRCRLTAEPGVANVWLGRPWRPYASVVFMNTEMGDHIQPAGWREWHPGDTGYLQTVFYAEYNSAGPGAHAAERDPHTKKLTAEEAARYETATFLAGSDAWNPTGPVSGSAPAGDIEKVHNEKVVVTGQTLAPGETRSFSAEHPGAVVYLENGEVEWTSAGKPERQPVKKGDSVFHAAQATTLKNTGAKPLHLVRIDFLGKGSSETWGAAGLAPSYKLLFENQYGRVYDIRIKAGTSGPLHTYHDRVVICLSGAQLRHEMPDGRTEVSTLKTGEIAWRRGGTHVGHNLGNTDLWVIAIEPK